MKSILLAAAVAACLCSAAIAAPKKTSEKVWTKEPTSFLGVNFSSNVVDSTPKCEKSWSHEEEALCYTPEILGTYFMHGVPSLGIGYGYDLAIKVVENQVDYFNLSTKSAAFAALSSLFVEKYGPPTSRSSEKIKTKSGAEFENEVLTWKGKQVSIVMQKYSGDINTSSVMVRSNTLAEKAIRESEAASKAGAAKL